VHLPTGAEAIAAATTMAVAVATAAQVASGRRRVGVAREARRWLAAGTGICAAATLVGLTGVVAYGPHWAHHRHQRTDLATVIAVIVAVGVAVLCVGLLRLPAAAGSRRLAVRHLLDALVIAFALWFVGWVAVSEPTRILGEATPRACTPIMITAATAALAFGVTAIVGLRCSGSRTRLVLIGGGITAAASAGVGLATGVCQVGPRLALASGVLMVVALGLVTIGALGADTRVAAAVDLTWRGTLFAFLPTLAIALAGLYHVLLGGRFTATAIALGSFECFALVARQHVALLDVRGYAARLADGEAHFRELAHTDPLTGLANRRGLLRALYDDVDGGPPCVLLGLDLDGFKIVNDMRGHDVGDQVLIEVGQRLQGNLRPGDVAARLGGDEFAVLMWARPPEAHRAAERLLGVLSLPYQQPHGRVFLSVSIGLAGPDTAPDATSLLHQSDLALRYAKQRGKNRVERYDASYERRLRRNTALEHEMRGAVERDELHLAFQPVAALPSMRPVGAEALLRWHHPLLGNVKPDEFIPLAEDCGMIAKLGSWVLHRACHQLSRWLADGHDVWVSVNVSPRELHAPDYVERVAEALRAHRVPPQRLVLEVTEHAVATDIDVLIMRLRALRATGVRIALDDFGAGYSSLGQLRRLPIDILKIDHSLVAEHRPGEPSGDGLPVPPWQPADEPPSARMVDVVVRLGHELGLEVIAEGVTNQRELAAVVDAGCRFGQGALFGWGVPAEHLEAMLDAATSSGARSAPVPAPSPTSPAVAPAPVVPSRGAGSEFPAGGASRRGDGVNM
jgi:diguanylate cyclase